MKKKILVFIFLIPIFAKSQIAYRDAVILKDFSSGVNNETKKAKLNGASQDVWNIIGAYFPSAVNIEKIEISSNPFIEIENNPQDGLISKNLGLIGSIRGLPVTTFADGLAQFMIERANEEINVWFFRKFKEDLDKSIELRTIFPLTNSFVQITEPYQYAQNLHLLREAFKKDLSEIIDNLEDLAILEKYRRIFEKSDELKIVLVGLAGASIVSKIKNGAHPADVIDSLGQKQYLDSINNNLLSSLILFSTLSQSLRSTNDGVAYIPASEFRINILSDDIGFRIYLGLLYQQLKDVGFSMEDQTKTIGEFLILEKEKILQSPSFGFQLLERLNTLEKNFEKIKVKSNTLEIKYLEWYNFYGSVLDLVEFGMDVSNILPITTREAFSFKAAGAKKFIYSARLGNEIFRNVNEKNYSLAVLNFSILYDTLIYRPISSNQAKIDILISGEITQLSSKNDLQKASYILSMMDNSYSLNADGSKLLKDEGPVDYKIALKQYYKTENIEDAIHEFKKQSKVYSIPSTKFIKYGAFMAAVADAEKPEDVKAALNAAALPAGSSSIKRQTPFNVSINSYLGFHGGFEKLDGKGWSGIWGISAPVGVAVSWGSNEQFKEKGSFSIYGSIIDIGAVASFRLKNEVGVENLPEFTLENIIAPGIYAVYGIPKAPISIGFGYQKGPQLRGITTSTQKEGEAAVITSDLANGYRWNLFIAVDIPLFNLYTKSK